MHAVERVRDVDDALLLADRGQRVGERHTPRDLLAEEQPDHLTVAVGLDLLARDHDQLARSRGLDRLPCAAEDVVIGDRDRAEPLGLGVVDKRGRLDRAVVRPARVHVQVGDDPLAVGERLGRRRRARRSSTAACLEVDALELLRNVRRSSRLRAQRAAHPHRGAGRLRPRRSAGARQPRQAPAARRRRAARRRAHPAAAASVRSRTSPSGEGTTIAASRRSVGARVAARRCPSVDALTQAERDRRSRRERGCPKQDRLPAVEAAERAERRADDRAARRRDVSITTRFALSGAGANRSRSTPAGTTAYAPGNRAAARSATSYARCEQLVDPGQQAVALVPPRWEAEALRVDEGRRGRGAGPRAARRTTGPGAPGSNPWTTSKSPRRSAVATFARTPTGSPTAERGVRPEPRGRSATTPSSSPVCSARRPARSSVEREDGASTTTACPRARSASATPATCSFVSCGTDHACGVTRQMRSDTGLDCRGLTRLSSWTTLTITVRPNGPYKIVGPGTIVDADGRAFELPEGSAVVLCRCGHSATKPFCDATHRRIGFVADDVAPQIAPAEHDRPSV